MRRICTTAEAPVLFHPLLRAGALSQQHAQHHPKQGLVWIIPIIVKICAFVISTGGP